jgi:hypothetical protein
MIFHRLFFWFYTECWAEKHTSNILFVVIKYIYKKPPKRIIPTKV